MEQEGKAVAAEIAASGGEAIFQKLDVTSEADWAAVVAETLATFGRLDILVNNAGISGSTPDLLNIDTWNQQMHVNAGGVFLGMRAVIPTMQKAGGGSIVNISSISGVVGQRVVHMGYNAAKGAIRTATKSAAVQFARDGIRVNSVHPGDPRQDDVRHSHGPRRPHRGSRQCQPVPRQRRRVLYHGGGTRRGRGISRAITVHRIAAGAWVARTAQFSQNLVPVNLTGSEIAPGGIWPGLRRRG